MGNLVMRFATTSFIRITVLKNVTNRLPNTNTPNQRILEKLRVVRPVTKRADFCVISGFRRDVEYICALLGYYSAKSGSSVQNYYYTLRNIPEEYRFLTFIESEVSLRCS
jgi:hypothetical protein